MEPFIPAHLSSRNLPLQFKPGQGPHDAPKEGIAFYQIVQ
jgi:hypothetical protein